MKAPTSISATDLNRRSGEILRQVSIQGKHFLIERGGYPLAVIISSEDYKEFLRAAGGILNKKQESGA